MPISDERREVAARLRDRESVWRKNRAHVNVVPGIPSTQYEDMAALLGFSGWTLGADVFARLADLIEPQKITEDTSDGYHTFRQLYYQRMKLFSVLVEEHIDRAWKTRRHEDGELCFGGGWFLVAIDTPNGTYGYHYEEKYWYEFDCDELPKAKPWDGYDERDVGRLMSLVGVPRLGQQERTCRISDTDHEYEDSVRCDACQSTFRRPWEPFKYCPECGARVVRDDDAS